MYFLQVKNVNLYICKNIHLVQKSRTLNHVLGGGGRESPVKHGAGGASRGGASTGGGGGGTGGGGGGTGGEGPGGGGPARAGKDRRVHYAPGSH
jgi:hypothetical protein